MERVNVRYSAINSLLQSVKMLKIKLFYLFEFGSQFLLCNNYTTYLIVCQVLFKENLICFYVITDRAYEMTRDKSTNPATIPFYLIKNYLLLSYLFLIVCCINIKASVFLSIAFLIKFKCSTNSFCTSVCVIL